MSISQHFGSYAPAQDILFEPHRPRVHPVQPLAAFLWDAFTVKRAAFQAAPARDEESFFKEERFLLQFVRRMADLVEHILIRSPVAHRAVVEKSWYRSFKDASTKQEPLACLDAASEVLTGKPLSSGSSLAPRWMVDSMYRQLCCNPTGRCATHETVLEGKRVSLLLRFVDEELGFLSAERIKYTSSKWMGTTWAELWCSNPDGFVHRVLRGSGSGGSLLRMAHVLQKLDPSRWTKVSLLLRRLRPAFPADVSAEERERAINNYYSLVTKNLVKQLPTAMATRGEIQRRLDQEDKARSLRWEQDAAQIKEAEAQKAAKATGTPVPSHSS